MTATVVSYTHLECDSCGTSRPTPTKGATSARLAAATEGWKFAEWDTRQQRILPRHWDACPECPLPEGPQDAHKIRQQRSASIIPSP